MDLNEKNLNEEVETEQTEQNEEIVNEEIAVENEEAVAETEINNSVEETEIENSDEAVKEETDEIVEEADAETMETDTQVEADEVVEEDVVTEVLEELAEEPKKKSSVFAIAAVSVLAVAVLVVAYLFFSGNFVANKYNAMGYPNPSGRTLGEVAESVGITVDEMISQYGLPEDMPADTTEMAVIYSMPAKNYLQVVYGIDFATAKAVLKIPDETTPNTPKTFIDKIKAIFVKDKIQPIDENTPWHIVENELTINDLSGGQVEEFKKYYELDETVTGETKIKEIIHLINKKTEEMMKEQEEAAQQTEQEVEQTADETSEESVSDEQALESEEVSE